MVRRVVVTALGMVTSLGDSAEAVARGVRAGQVTFAPCDHDPRLVVAPVADFDARRYTGRYKNLRYLNRGAAMAAAAALRAAQQAGLTAEQWETAGLFVGAGPNLDLGGECPQIRQGILDGQELPALWILRFLPNTAASTIAQLTGIRGENLTVGTACAASLQAVGEAFRKIKDGYLNVALAGGGDSRLNPGAMLAYQKAQALCRGSEAPQAAMRPFDQGRSGFVPGEGGAFFVLEAVDHALARRAPILAEVCGYGASMDGEAMTAPRSDGRWAEAAVRSALDQTPVEQISLISAHGTATRLNDAMEARMIRRIFDPHRPLVLALKSWIGHLAAACGAAELAVCLGALQTGVWPWVRNLDTPCNPRLNFLRCGGPVVAGHILVQNFGFGGQNAALVVRPWQI
jgi:3-oxoacyl-[acyl-carrier-protein] synthase II